VPQNKVAGEDLWDHTLRSVDAAPANRPVVRLAALLHDIGKPATLADGHFHHHEVVGARLADGLLRRMRYPRAAAEEVVHLVRHHMFFADPTFGDPAIRRFIQRIGPDRVEALFELRRADDIGSGQDPDDAALATFRSRVHAELEAEAALDRFALAIDGNDLMRDLGLAPGPHLGHLIDALVEKVLEDPGCNTRATLLLLAQGMLADMETPPDHADHADHADPTSR
jgi:putative nucleotidyltransferase with HDIG domain